MAGEGYVVGVGIRDVFDEVLRARVAYVVCPWIQEPYASKLFNMVVEGRAKVVTSMDKENALYALLGNVGTRSTATLVAGIALLVIGAFIAIPGAVTALTSVIAPSSIAQYQPIGFTTAALFWIGLAELLFGLLFLVPGIILMRKYLRGKKLLREKPWLSNIRLSPPMGQDGFIHIKLYIADDRAWVGSANMTVSAWKHNVEVLVPIDLETARRIFEKAWSAARPPA